MLPLLWPKQGAARLGCARADYQHSDTLLIGVRLERAAVLMLLLTAAEICDLLTRPVRLTDFNDRAKWQIVIRFAKFNLLASLTDNAHLVFDCWAASLLA